MTVDEIIAIERKYKEEHKTIRLVRVNVESMPDINDDIRFLNEGYIEKYHKIKPERKKRLAQKGLSEFEMVMLNCFLCGLSYAFKWSSYEDKESPIPEMCEGLDSVLDKSPTYDEGGKLYRFCTRDDEIFFEEGQTHTFPHYLNTTKDNNWRDDNHMYIITPKNESTNARSIYKLQNHGNENQVTFKRDTSFKITKVESYKTKNEEYRRIYMEEL
jgi:hypothetical protein